MSSAQVEIETLKAAIEAERSRERGAKDCIALQHQHMEALHRIFDRALQAENKSHKELLEVRCWAEVAALRCLWSLLCCRHCSLGGTRCADVLQD